MADKISDKIKEGVDTVKDTFRLGYEALYKGDKQAEKDYLDRKNAAKDAKNRGNQADPGYDLSVDGGTLRAKIKSPSERIANEVEASRGKESNRYASGGRVRGVGAAKRGFGRGRIT